MGGHAEVTVGVANITNLGPGAHCAREAIWGTLGPQLGLRGPSAHSPYGGNMTCFCCLTVTKCTIAHQAPLSMGFSGQDYCSGFPCLPPRDLPDPRIAPASLHLLHCRQIPHC